MADTSIPLEINHLHKSFNGNPVLNGLSLKAQKGDVITLIGASGSGKSTFLRCMNLLEMPDQGELIVHGEAIGFKVDRKGQRQPEDWKQVERIRARLSMVFQNFNLWPHMTLIENVMAAPVHVLKMPKAQAREKGMALLKRVGLSERASYFPTQMSGGQQQRGAIARALAMDPEVMLFDEPTSALDPELVGDVLHVMHELADEGRTMIVVTHEMDFARDVSNHVMFLHQGLIEEQGAPGDILTSPRSERLQQFLAPRY
ncbi:ABC transporter ATP-binding protein [Larsenimonas rhizosphaerae]|uniref:ATP-binding cassette domain-containing protein n=1 Tax=Larsenimonas rhizosphaerae TaxID=2944682 RepID=A0AA41ZJG4_9GAMM|nr:ATP-binding cassette domain-containing protein [Larsenimonas rhizosphaerae]MCM2129944.1 ATP-binding cassette domain-containing protein [Larsenimonas rhizosphaerae]MCX2522643.1 ATP-binding cassette domain-containing protein [Larsenimonas rhizosphaerae]